MSRKCYYCDKWLKEWQEELEMIFCCDECSLAAADELQSEGQNNILESGEFNE